MNHRAWMLLLIGIASVAGGASGRAEAAGSGTNGWPEWRHDPHRTGYSALPGDLTEPRIA